jgi:hypothetical protein
VDEWNKNHKTMVLLQVSSEKELEKWEDKLKKEKIQHTVFMEPYIGNQKTAIAVLPKDPKFFSSLRLF